MARTMRDVRSFLVLLFAYICYAAQVGPESECYQILPELVDGNPTGISQGKIVTAPQNDKYLTNADICGEQLSFMLGERLANFQFFCPLIARKHSGILCVLVSSWTII